MNIGDLIISSVDDPNDFDNLAMAQVVFEDAYLMILTVDGEEYVDKLRDKLNRTAASARPSSAHEESSWLLSKA